MGNGAVKVKRLPLEQRREGSPPGEAEEYPMCLGGCVSLCITGNSPVSFDSFSFFLLQGVEFFDEKLNSLCMAWLVDHGESLRQVGEDVGAPGRMDSALTGACRGVESLPQAICRLCGPAPFLESWIRAGWEGKQSRSPRGDLARYSVESARAAGQVTRAGILPLAAETRAHSSVKWVRTAHCFH